MLGVWLLLLPKAIRAGSRNVYMTLNAVSNLDRNWPAKVVFGGVDLLAVNECLKVQGHSYGAMLQ